jgi:hypothetical protein
VADLKITELPPISGGAVQADKDFLALADSSASETKKVTPAGVVLNALAQPDTNGGVPNGTVDPDKIDWDGLDPSVIDGDAIKDASLSGNKLEDNSIASQKLIDGSIDAATKLLDQSITEPKYGPGSVSTRALADASVTADKLAADAAVGNIQDGTLDGSALIDGTVSNAKLQTIQTDAIGDNAITTDKIGANQIVSQHIANDSIENRHLNDNVTDIDGGLTVNANGLAIANTIVAGSQAGINYDEHGLVTGVVADGLVPRVDLPLATEIEVGAVSVPVDGGLEVSGTGALSHQNDIVASDFAGISFDANGHITATDAGGKVPPAFLPLAGTTDADHGVIYIPDQDPLRVDSDGALVHENSGAGSGNYSKVTVNATGHVVLGGNIDESDIPDLDASIITTGQFGTTRIADGAITAPKHADYATCLMQESNPGAGDFLGQLWYTPSTAQLRVYSRGSGPQNLWLAVGFGNLQANNLRWGGTFNADLDSIGSVTALGTSEGLTAGAAFPAPSDALSGLYLLCQVAGSNCTQNNIQSQTFTAGDWALCLDATQGWVFIDANGGSGGGGGGGGAQYLNDLLDVNIGGNGGPFGTAPRMALETKQLLKFDGGDGLWKNTDLLDGGTF